MLTVSLSVLLLSSLTAGVKVRTCCPPAQLLDLSTPDLPRCVNSDDGEVSKRPGPDQNIELDGSRARLPSCEGRRETHNLTAGEGKVTREGELVTERYGANYSVEAGGFCVDTTALGEMIAVSCNPCEGSEMKCISLCCPHGQAFITNPDYDYTSYDPSIPAYICSQVEEGGSYSPEVRNINSDEILHWEETRHYLLRAPPSSGFSCPSEFAGASWVPESVGEFGLVSDGRLRGSGLPEHSGDPVQFWQPGEFCLVMGSPPDYDYTEDSQPEGEAALRLSFLHCLGKEEPTWQEKFINIFHPTALGISTVFMIIILVTYILLARLRDSLVGKITMGFLTNLIICYIVITDSYLKESWGIDRRETTACVVTGYAILYFFHCYFLWLNSMAINIWLSFSSSALARLRDRTKLLVCLLYSQGLPLLLCLATALIDHSGRGLRAESLLSHPEVGKYSCYLGSILTSQPRSYFTSPEFIYQQSVLILVQISNIVFLVLTGLIIRSAGQQEKKAAAREHFLSFVKIFLVLGFTWTADVISTALAVEHGWEETFYVRLMLDLVNLFLGVLLFVFLVCNRTVMLEARARILSRSLSNNYDPDELKMSEVGDTELPVQFGSILT